MELVTALMIEPERKPCITQLCCDSEYLRYALDIKPECECSVDTLVLENDIAILYVPDSIFYGMKPNRKIGRKIITGTFYVVKVRNEELCSLTESEIVRYSLRFRETELWNDEDALDAFFGELDYLS